jgi:hypothetical protein
VFSGVAFCPRVSIVTCSPSSENTTLFRCHVNVATSPIFFTTDSVKSVGPVLGKKIRTLEIGNVICSNVSRYIFSTFCQIADFDMAPFLRYTLYNTLKSSSIYCNDIVLKTCSSVGNNAHTTIFTTDVIITIFIH